MTSTDEEQKRSAIIASLEEMLVELDEREMTLAAIKIAEAIDALKNHK